MSLHPITVCRSFIGGQTRGVIGANEALVADFLVSFENGHHVGRPVIGKGLDKVIDGAFHVPKMDEVYLFPEMLDGFG